jgi:hypothetical protein
MSKRSLAFVLGVLIVFGSISALRASDWTIGIYKITPVAEVNIALTTAVSPALSSPLSSADSAAISDTVPLRSRSTRGCPRVILTPTLSDNTATVCLEVALYTNISGAYRYTGICHVATFTGMVRPTSDSGRFGVTDRYWSVPTMGAHVYDVRVGYISAGNVTWRGEPLGGDTGATTTTTDQ